MARNYRNYIIYQKGYELALYVYSITENFPPEEKNNIVSQMRRASTSIPLNIAEGSAKKSSREFLHFLTIAYGSAKELAVLIDLSKDLGYLKEEMHNDAFRLIDNYNKKIFLFIRHIEKESGYAKGFFQKYSPHEEKIETN